MQSLDRCLLGLRQGAASIEPEEALEDGQLPGASLASALEDAAAGAGLGDGRPAIRARTLARGAPPREGRAQRRRRRARSSPRAPCRRRAASCAASAGRGGGAAAARTAGLVLRRPPSACRGGRPRGRPGQARPRRRPRDPRYREAARARRRAWPASSTPSSVRFEQFVGGFIAAGPAGRRRTWPSSTPGRAVRHATGCRRTPRRSSPRSWPATPAIATSPRGWPRCARTRSRRDERAGQPARRRRALPAPGGAGRRAAPEPRDRRRRPRRRPAARGVPTRPGPTRRRAGDSSRPAPWSRTATGSRPRSGAAGMADGLPGPGPGALGRRGLEGVPPDAARTRKGSRASARS